MSTIETQNFKDLATSKTIDAAYVTDGTAKAWGACDAAGTANNSGTFNVSSITDQGTNGKDFSITSSFTNIPNCALGQTHICRWGNTDGFILEGTSGITTGLVSVRYNNGSSYVDTSGSFSAVGDLA